MKWVKTHESKMKCCGRMKDFFHAYGKKYYFCAICEGEEE